MPKVPVVRIDPVLHRVFTKGKWIRLTKMEFRLLEALIRAKGVPLAAEQLLQLVGATRKKSGPDYIKLYIWYLRRKMEEEPGEPKIILTERGLGYRFVGRVTFASAGSR